MLVDSHCHLDFPDFEPERDEVVKRAHDNGVGHMVTISTHIRAFPKILEIAERYEQVTCSVGTHPHNATEERGIPVEDIVALAAHPRVVAIGEAGLDYFYDKSRREDQEAGFRTHIAAARETGLPLVIHTRDADADTARILTEEMAKGPFKAVLHCFTGGEALARTGIELGLYISFSGILTFPKSDALRAIAASLPADRILVETDAPFLAPGPKRGKRNEPAFVRHTAEVLAKTRGVREGEIETITTENFFRLFAKAAPFERGASSPMRDRLTS
jgi:TatD DNase family protein